MKRILVVDDEQDSCELLRDILASQGWNITMTPSPKEAIRLATAVQFDLVVSDLRFGEEISGLDLLKHFRTQCPVILITGYASLDTAIESTREGAWDYITKPFDIEPIIETARYALAQRFSNVNGGPATVEPEIAGMMKGRAPAMVQLYKQIAKVALSSSTALVLGESGTGKELVARALHQYSSRKTQPFVPVNCGALTETLLEAELFGHVKGSFTGAVHDRRGLWEEADGGTLFLDEIGELSQSLQVKLLRALQSGEVRRVGASRAVRINARIVAATNRNLEQEAKAGTFREDLFYRLSVLTLSVPPLRERREDIALLANGFLTDAAAKAGRSNLWLGPETVELLFAYDWPGNVRELESALEYAALNARGSEITPADLPERIQRAVKPIDNFIPL
jgi:DNA-binding NtrC family response regulator